mgnify:CR=1 FL=1
MNYMLIENTTLSSMKVDYSEYQKVDLRKEPSPNDEMNAHKFMITCMIVIKPQDLMQESSYQSKNSVQQNMSVSEYKKKIKFVTGDKNGIVKVWSGMSLKREV